MIKSNITDVVLNFYDRINNDCNHRYKSWEHCFNHFNNKSNIDIEKSCLHLAFYLASWGMYRGSSYLLWKDYKIFEPIIYVLKKHENIKNNYTPEDYFIEQILLLRKELEYSLQSIIKIVNGEDKNINPSDTLITKIILGVLGIIPAYDRLFLTGIKVSGLKNTSFNEKSIIELLSFSRNNKNEIEIIQKIIHSKSNIEYPRMKIIDMYFWEIGNILESIISINNKIYQNNGFDYNKNLLQALKPLELIIETQKYNFNEINKKSNEILTLNECLYLLYQLMINKKSNDSFISELEKNKFQNVIEVVSRKIKYKTLKSTL